MKQTHLQTTRNPPESLLNSVNQSGIYLASTAKSYSGHQRKHFVKKWAKRAGELSGSSSICLSGELSYSATWLTSFPLPPSTQPAHSSSALSTLSLCSP